jgi:D-xylonolactonase
VWDERTQTLYWVDIERGELRHCQADGSKETSIPIGQRIGCAALRSHEPGFIVGLEHSISLLTLNPVAIRPLAEIDPDLPGNRCNDGKCDREGRFWVGTCDEAGVKSTGWLFRLEAAGDRACTGALARTVGPYICVNGPAFSPDGRTLYCVDSYGKVVYRYALAPSGALSGERVFRRFDEPGWGYPDGLTCDVEGCVWIAHWGGSRVSRFSPDGELLDVIHFPVLQPSSCTFGGPNLTQLFVTTAAVGLDGSSNTNGLAGAVFAVDLEVGGLPPARYNG